MVHRDDAFRGGWLVGQKIERKRWSPEQVSQARAMATGDTALLLELLLGTGQRIGDVLALQWGQVHAAKILFRQSTTKAALEIPLTPGLASMLAAQPRKGPFVLLSKRAGRLSHRDAADRMRKLRTAVSCEAGQDIHALRYTTAAELAAVGCSDELMQSITRHSVADPKR